MSPLHRIPFYFHAEGHAFSGEFRHPLWSPIHAQASASLPTIGGHAESEVSNFHFQDFVHFERAHTHISGKRRRAKDKDGSYARDKQGNDVSEFVSHASTTIHNLNILGRIKADRIVCRLTSVHKHGEIEGHIIAEDSRFDGLRIDGQEVRITLRHKLLVDCKTHGDLERTLAASPRSGDLPVIDGKRKVAICSLVEKIDTKLPGVDPKLHLIKIEGFGKIFFAEVFAEPGTRTLTMLRIELGSPHVADMTVAETRTNGQQSPPPGP